MLSKIENEKVQTFLQNLSASATKSMHRQTLFLLAIRTKEENWAKTDLERTN